MANNQHVNKFIFGSETKFDLTGDTVSEDKLISGYTAHDKSGAPITGTCDYDVNSQDANAAVAEILNGRTAYARGAKLTGTMPNNGAVNASIAAKAEQYSVPMGFHDGSGKVSIAATEQAKLIAGNIKSGVNILGVVGSYGGESVSAQAKSVTPSMSPQTVLPDSGYDYLSQVTVASIPYTETDNAAGGKTITVG